MSAGGSAPVGARVHHSGHIGTQDGAEPGQDATGEPPPGQTLTVWPGAALAVVSGKRGTLLRMPGLPHGDERPRCKGRRADGERCRRPARWDSDFCAAHDGVRAVKRSAVTEFSRSSRRRMLRYLATIDRDAASVLVTLTWPAQYAPDAAEWRRCLKAWRERFRREFPAGAFCWRREFTKVGTVHLHLLVFGVRYGKLRRFCAPAWAAVVASPHPDHLRAGTRVERPITSGGVQRYISKYISKLHPGEPEGEAWGAHWGIHNREMMPTVEPVVKGLSDDGGARYRRAMLRAMRPRKGTARWAGRVGMVRNPAASITVIGTAERWAALAEFVETQVNPDAVTFAACSDGWGKIERVSECVRKGCQCNTKPSAT